MLRRLIDNALEYLRINAIRRLIAATRVRKIEIFSLAVLSTLFAALEGLGLSLLLPVLQFAESGRTVFDESSGFFWSTIAALIRSLHLPLNLVVLLLLAFVPILLRQVVYYLNTWLSATVGTRVAHRMRMDAVDAILRANLDYYDRRPMGHLVGAVTAQSETTGEAILAVMRMLSVTLLMSLYLAIMIALSVPLSFTTLLFAVLVWAVVRRCITSIRAFSQHAISVSQDMTGKILERFSFARIIKMRHSEEEESQRIDHMSREMRSIRIMQARLGATIEVLADPLLMLSAFVTLYVGIALLQMTLAQLGLMLFLINRLNAKVKEFNDGRQQISQKMASLLLLKSIIDEAHEARDASSGERPFRHVKKGITFHDVSFSFPQDPSQPAAENAEGKVLRDISFEIPSGSLVAIVGRSGEGKSTILELIPRLREPTSGSIRIDDIDIREFDLGSLRRKIGYLTQDPMLLNDTIKNNLSYALDRIPTDDELAAALQAANADFVFSLPKGLDTVLGDRGSRLSGGERQRIALARILLEDASILLLDEPTSALDSESESAIHRALLRLKGDKTIVTVAHRLATVIDADRIFVIEDGRIVQRGTHAELAAVDGPYRRLFESQMIA